MKKILLTHVLLLFAFSGVRAQSEKDWTIVFKGGDNIIIGEYVSIMEDSSNRMEIQDAVASKDYVQSDIQTPNRQLSQSAFWVKFTIRNESNDNPLLLELEYPTLEICDLYSPRSDSFIITHLTDRSAFNHRKYKHQNFIFDINVPHDSTATFYLKVRSTELVVLPLLLGTPQRISEGLFTKDLLWGILIGIFAVMVIYNLFVFISTRDRSYLFYVFYGLTMGLTQTTLSGYTYRFIFYNTPLLAHWGIIIFPALGGLSGILFVRSFLHTKENTPRLHKLFILWIITYSSAIVFRISGLDYISFRIIDFSGLVTIFSIYAVAIVRSYQGYRPAKIFLIAWSIFFAGIVMYILRNFGILPYSLATNYTMQAGTAAELTLLSIALADKINIFRKEKEASQAEALAIAKENERIIREQNIMLEQKVTERTSELTSALGELKEAQSQLVEQEKMASLGQLTAGIAHEINNPINFVTSNVKPLKRDVELLIDLMNKIETIGTTGAMAEPNKAEIAKLKKDYDFDYLMEEIQFLLKGINEGSSRTAEIVKGLRLFSRVDEDDIKLANINEGIDSTLIIINNIIGDKIVVKKDYAPLNEIECYPGKLNQVFLNIVSNAAYAIKTKFGNEPGGEVSIKTYIEGPDLNIVFADNGSGMDNSTKNKLFEPFFTTKPVGEGTGLGLSIAYNTIKKHNGSIKVESELNKGSAFHIKIPITQTNI